MGVEQTGADPGAAITIRGLTVRRGDRLVLDGLELDIERGEIFGLLGPNGAGKTSLFHVLTGLLPPVSGEFTFEGRRTMPGDARFRSATGVVFQEPALDPRLSARRNLFLAARLYGVPKAIARSRIETLLERAGLSDRGDDPISTFSGGMRRRVELARGLIHEPSLLILDEPTIGLDEGAFRQFWNDLRISQETSDMTVVLTTHRADEAERCDRLGILDRGRVIASGTPDELRRRVRGDLLILETGDTESVADQLRTKFDLEPLCLDGRVLVRLERAHELIPRLVETLPPGTLDSIGMRRTGMGEVFLELTGNELSQATGAGDASALR